MSTDSDATTVNKSEAIVKSNEGTRLFEAGDVEGAIKAFAEAIKLDPRFEAAYHNRAMALRKAGRHREAEVDLYQVSSIQQSLEKALEHDQRERKHREVAEETDRLAVLANDQGLRQLAAGDFQAAVNSFTEALQRDPKLQSAYRNRAQAYRKLGMVQEAEADLGNLSTRGLSLGALGISRLGISSTGDVFEKIAYAIAIAMAAGFMIGVWAILGTTGVVSLLGMALFVWTIKWSWIWFLK